MTTTLAQFRLPLVDSGNINTKDSIPFRAATLHSLIVIDSNTKFTSDNGVVSGTGTMNDPYLITNWIINTTANNIGINIANTDMYVQIMNCLFTNGTFGIAIENAKNVLITNNLFENMTGKSGTQTPANNTSGEDGSVVTAIYCANVTNLEISSNIIRNISSGNGGPAGNSTTTGIHDGGSSGGFIGINLKLSQSIRIKNNLFENLLGGSGGRGSNGFNSTTGSAGDGGDGGQAAESYGIYSQSNFDLQITNNVFKNLTGGTGGNGGNGGNTSFNGAYGGDGGRGGSGGNIYGIIIFDCVNPHVENNSLEKLKAGAAGLSGNGGSCVIGTGGNGGEGSSGGLCVGLYISEITSIRVLNNVLTNLTSGNGGKGGNRGTYSSSGTNGVGGAGGDSGQVVLIYMLNSENILIKFNSFSLMTVGSVGYGGSGAVSGELTGISCGLYFSNNQNSSFLYNNMFEAQNFVNDLTRFSDGWYGNYWSAYTGIDTSHPKDGIGDSSYIVNGSHVDVTPLIYPITLDSDNDGLMNWQEIEYMTNMVSRDSDGDLCPDPWEIAVGLNPTNALDGAIDSDGDQLLNYAEYLYGTDPFLADTNGDGFTDLENFQNKTSSASSENTTNTDSDSEQLTPAPVTSWLESYQVLIVGGAILLGVILHGFIVRPKVGPQIPADTSHAGGAAELKHVSTSDLKVSTISEKKTPDPAPKKPEKSEKGQHK